MTIHENAGAEASVVEAVADDKTAVAAKTELAEGAEAEEDAADPENALHADAGEEGVEGAEGVDDKPTKSKLRREKQKARIEALEVENRRLSENLRAVERTKPAADALSPVPERSKYTDEAEYVADLAVYKAEKSALERQVKTHETTTNNARGDAAAAKMNLFKERAMALSDRYPDIEAKVFEDRTLPMSAVMAETIMESEKGPEVAYYLSANREVAQRIKEMQPLAAARELGRIEATLSLPTSRTKTNAPPPPNTLKGSLKKVSVDPTKLQGAAYREWRSKQPGF
jgi:hypothetical protein